MAKDFFWMFREGANDLVKKPAVILPSIVFGLALLGVSKIGLVLAPQFQTTLANVLWTIFVGVLTFIVGSYVFSGMINMVHEKKKWIDFKKGANKFWLKNFVVLIFVALVSFLIGRIAHYGAFYIGRTIGLEATVAMALFVLIYLAGLIGVLMFLTFSSFFLVVYDLSIVGAIKRSASFVKKNYFATLALNVVFFVVWYLFNEIPTLFGDLLIYAIVVPFFVLVLTKFIEK